MIVKFEKPITVNDGKVSLYKYKNLNNLYHWHKESEFIYVSKGEVEVNADNKKYLLKSGMCAFFKSGEMHSIKGTPQSITIVVKTSSKSILNITDNKKLEVPVLEKNYDIENLLVEIEDELKLHKEYSNIIVDSIITHFAALIFRTEKTQNDDNTSEKNKKLLAWIMDNYNHISFENAAKYMNFSKTYFSDYFQKLTGLKFSHYLNILKVSAAVEKIKSGEKNMTEISISSGFGTIRNFNRVFKNLTGHTPKSLPLNYVYPYLTKNGEDEGFDPTLNCSEIII